LSQGKAARKRTLVPLCEDVRNLGLVETESALEDVVGFADELHVAILDTVVDHLDVL
jgi:hypothetical protein